MNTYFQRIARDSRRLLPSIELRDDSEIVADYFAAAEKLQSAPNERFNSESSAAIDNELAASNPIDKIPVERSLQHFAQIPRDTVPQSISDKTIAAVTDTVPSFNREQNEQIERIEDRGWNEKNKRTKNRNSETTAIVKEATVAFLDTPNVETGNFAQEYRGEQIQEKILPQYSPQAAVPVERGHEQYHANFSIEKNTRKVTTEAAPVIEARNISAPPPAIAVSASLAQTESKPQLHIGEVRITVQDEPRKMAKPKRKRNGESESRLLIRSL